MNAINYERQRMVGFKTVKTGYNAVRAVKSGIDAVCHPMQWAKDQLTSAIKTMLVRALKQWLGDTAAKAMVERLDLEGKTYPLKLSVPLHSKLQSLVSNPEHVDFVEQVVNDALAIPLQALGYRLAQVEFACPPEGATLELRAQIGLQRMDRPMEMQNTLVLPPVVPVDAIVPEAASPTMEHPGNAAG